MKKFNMLLDKPKGGRGAKKVAQVGPVRLFACSPRTESSIKEVRITEQDGKPIVQKKGFRAW